MSAAFHPLDADTDYADGGSGGGISTEAFVLALLYRSGLEGPFIAAAMKRLIAETAESFVKSKGNRDAR